MASNEDDRAGAGREFFRIKTTLPLRATAVAADDYREIANDILTRLDPAVPDVDPALIGWLDRIERKLDRLLDHHGVAASDRIDERDRLAIEISGSGLSFPCAMPFEVSSAVLVEFELPETPIRLVRALGRVVDLEGASGDHVGVAFETVRQVDRDAVVRYTLAVQRQEILAGEESR